MQSVGEVTTMFPVHGGFIEHTNRFVDPALSFALSWLYYIMWSIYLPSGEYGLPFYFHTAAILMRSFYRLECSSPNSELLDTRFDSSVLGVVPHILGLLFCHHYSRCGCLRGG